MRIFTPSFEDYQIFTIAIVSTCSVAESTQSKASYKISEPVLAHSPVQKEEKHTSTITSSFKGAKKMQANPGRLETKEMAKFSI